MKVEIHNKGEKLNLTSHITPHRGPHNLTHHYDANPDRVTKTIAEWTEHTLRKQSREMTKDTRKKQNP
jgi:hypothetical protein